MNLIIYLQVNVNGFFKFPLSFQVCVARHAQIAQNNKFAISLQYLNKELSDEVDFLHADKHQSFLKVYFNTLDICVSYKIHIIINEHDQISLKVTSLQYLYNISKKKSGMKVIFDMQINVKVSISWSYHFWSKWPDMSKVPKIGNW